MEKWKVYNSKFQFDNSEILKHPDQSHQSSERIKPNVWPHFGFLNQFSSKQKTGFERVKSHRIRQNEWCWACGNHEENWEGKLEKIKFYIEKSTTNLGAHTSIEKEFKEKNNLKLCLAN